MATLLAIAEDVQALLDLVDQADAELTPEIEQALEAWFAEIKGQEAHKLDGYCALIRTLELRSAARKEEQERLAKLVSVEANKARRLKDRLKLYLEITGTKKVETDRYRISLVANGGKLPMETPPDADTLPMQFVRREQRLVVETDILRAALEAGETVPGCRLLPRGRHLRIA